MPELSFSIPGEFKSVIEYLVTISKSVEILEFKDLHAFTE
jgi:hypothetical protein